MRSSNAARGVSNGAILCLHDGRELRAKPDIGETVEAVRRLVPDAAGPGVQIRNGKPTTMSDELIQRVLKVIATSKRIPLETVTIDSEFQQLGIDSMDAVEILFALENEFDISIPDDEVRSVRNVRQMCEGVEKLVAAKSDAAASQ